MAAPIVVLWPGGCRWCGAPAFYASGGVCLGCGERGATASHGPTRPARPPCRFCVARARRAPDVLVALRWAGEPCRRWHRRRTARAAS